MHFSHGLGLTLCYQQAFSRVLDLSGLNEGSIELTAWLADSGNNKASFAVNLAKDTLIPTMEFAAPLHLDIVGRGENIVTLSGDCSENATITFSHDWGTAPCDGAHFEKEINLANIPEGPFQIEATITDPASNVSRVSLELNKDAIEPVFSIVTPAEPGFINSTNANTFRVEGTCNDPTATLVFLNTGKTAMCDGQIFSVELDLSGLDDGNVLLEVALTDLAGNKVTDEVPLEKDVVVPTVTITTPKAQSWINRSNVSSLAVEGTCQDETATFSFNDGVVPTGEVSCENGEFHAIVDASDMSDGSEKMLVIERTDDAQNTGRTQVSVKKDTISPQYGALDIVDEDSFSRGSSIRTINSSQQKKGIALKIAAGPNSSFNLRAYVVETDRTLYSTYILASNGFALPLREHIVQIIPEGESTIRVYLSEASGNTNSKDFRITKDTTVPVLTLTTPLEGDSIQSDQLENFVISGTCDENGQDIKFSLNSDPQADATTTCTEGIFGQTLDIAAIDEGAFTLGIEIEDGAGNRTKMERNLFKDMLEPAVAFGSDPATNVLQANVAAFPVSGSCTDETGSIDLKVGSNILQDNVPCNSGAFSAQLDLSGINDGTVELTAVNTDASGNDATATLSLTKDTSGPRIAFHEYGSVVTKNTATAVILRGDCDEDQAVITFSDNLGTATCNGTDFTSASLNLTPLMEGNINVTATIVGANGNRERATLSLFKDTTPPSLAVAVPAEGAYINKNNMTSFSVSGTCNEANGSVTFSSGSESVLCDGTGFATTLDLSSLPENDVTLTVTIFDEHQNPTAISIGLKKDTIVPQIEITGSTINGEPVRRLNGIHQQNGDDLLVSGTCDDETASIRLNFNGTSQEMNCASNTFSTSLRASSFPEGETQLEAVIEDSAGNTHSHAWLVEKDSVSPTITLATTQTTIDDNITSISVSGTCNEEGGVIIFSHGTTAQGVLCTNGAFDTTLYLDSANDGTIPLTASIDDGFHNRGTSASVALTKTTTATLVLTIPGDPTDAIDSNNVTAYPIEGTCNAPEDTIKFTANGAAVGTTLCQSTRSFATELDLSSLPDNQDIVIVATIRESDTHPVTATFTAWKDSNPPLVAITSPKQNSFVNRANQESIAIVGNCDEQDGTVTFSHEGSAVPLATGQTSPVICDGTNFVTTLDLSSLPDDAAMEIVVAIDDANNNEGRGILNLVKDTHPPVLTFTAPTRPYPPVTSKNVQNPVSFSGTCNEEVADITFETPSFNFNGAITTCGNDRTFSEDLDFSDTEEGLVKVTVTATDAAGNRATFTIDILKDVTPPTMDLATPEDNGFINIASKNSFEVSGSCDDSSQLIGATMGDGTTTLTESVHCDGTEFSLTFNTADDKNTALNDGAVTLTVSAADDFGNEISYTRRLIKDTVPPPATSTVAITTPDPAATELTEIKSKNVLSVNIRGTCNENSLLIVFSTGGGELGRASCNGTRFNTNLNLSNLENGDVTVTAEVTDAAGNRGKTSSSVTYKLNNLPFTSVWYPGDDYKVEMKVHGPHNFIIDWDDGTTERFTKNDPTIKYITRTYENADRRTVTITGTLPAITITSGGFGELKEIPELGNVGWKKFFSTFQDVVNLTIVRGGDTSEVTDMANMFRRARNATPDTSHWDTSKVTRMRGMFNSALRSRADVSGWDVGKVNDFYGMFIYVKYTPNVSNWNTSRGENFGSMFKFSDANPNVSGWDVSSGTLFEDMFRNSSHANPNLSNWNLKNRNIRSNGFIYNSKISEENLSNFINRLLELREDGSHNSLKFDIDYASTCYLSSAAGAVTTLTGSTGDGGYGWTLNINPCDPPPADDSDDSNF